MMEPVSGSHYSKVLRVPLNAEAHILVVRLYWGERISIIMRMKMSSVDGIVSMGLQAYLKQLNPDADIVSMRALNGT
jgi:hypothetical protein